MTFWLRVPCDWRRPTAAERYDLFWSRTGRFGQLHPRPSRAEVAGFYAVDYYTHGGPELFPPPGRRTFLERLREHLAWRADYGAEITPTRLASLTTGKTPSVFEIGCGDGQLLAALCAAGWRATGIEPDPIARALALGRGLEVYDGTAEEPPPELRGRVFDVVILQHVLEHCLDPIRGLQVASEHLGPDGVLVVETPNNESSGCRQAGTAWPWLDVPRHLNFFTGHSLRQACLLAGLSPVATEYTGYARQFQRWWLEMEEHIRAALRRGGCGPQGDLGPVAWRRLIRTAFAPPRYKYDSVRVIARNRG